MGNFWKENLLAGFRNAWEWMGVRGFILDILVAATIALILGQNAGEAVLVFALVVLGIYALLSLYFGLFVIPFERYQSQERIIAQRIPEQLDIFVGPSPLWGIINEQGNRVPQALLAVISREKKKIVELHAVRTELLERTALTPADIRGKTFMSGWRTFYFAWQNNEKFIELLPGDTFQLLLGEFDLDVGRPVFGIERFHSPSFRHQAIYEVHVRFKGKLEGDTDFRYFDYQDELLCDPNVPAFEFAKNSAGIPKDLEEKIYLSKTRHR